MLSTVDGKSIRTINGRKKLRKKIVKVIKTDIKRYIKDDISIENVYFTKFVMQ